MNKRITAKGDRQKRRRRGVIRPSVGSPDTSSGGTSFFFSEGKGGGRKITEKCEHPKTLILKSISYYFFIIYFFFWFSGHVGKIFGWVAAHLKLLQDKIFKFHLRSPLETSFEKRLGKISDQSGQN